ncbi:hypothetical protein EYF80_062018 [Liparis tanakae]|uniref:Uncharacterized protein n=1 Tax=Liparis tanakae TaxID=230148 RepID=A0A4Z2EGI0_9TELE|nr:hypothetical protein EYF80_062018 [Liparis tanakae]
MFARQSTEGREGDADASDPLGNLYTINTITYKRGAPIGRECKAMCVLN